MTTPLDATEDFEQMMQMLSGCWLTQIAGAVACYSVADHLAKGSASVEEISPAEGVNSTAALRLLRAHAGKLPAGNAVRRPDHLNRDAPGREWLIGLRHSVTQHDGYADWPSAHADRISGAF